MLHLPLIARIVPLFLLLLVAFSCEREYITPVAQTKNTPPIANAGSDTTVYLPESRDFMLDGSSSYDPDGRDRIVKYEWTQLSGPRAFTFMHDASIYAYSIEEPGTYQIELKVTDTDQNVDRDTIAITGIWGISCNPSAEKVSSSIIFDFKMSEYETVPIDVSFGGGGKYLAFAGGRTVVDYDWAIEEAYSNIVLVYDRISRIVYRSELFQKRGKIGIVVTDSDIFFAGGKTPGHVSDVVDIFNLFTKSMSMARLSAPRSSISSAGAGDKVFFAGGVFRSGARSDVVDIYDQNTRTWSVARLSQARAGISVVSSGSKVFFAGGDTDDGEPSSRIDVYDLHTGQWSTLKLPTPRFDMNSSLVGNKIVFAGGYSDAYFTKAKQADFLDLSSLSFTSECLLSGGNRTSSEYIDVVPHGPNMASAVVNGRDYYHLNNNMITRYQSDTKKWSFTVNPFGSLIIGMFSDDGSLFGILLNQPDQWAGDYPPANISIYQISF